MFQNNSLSPADVVALNGENGFGGNNSWIWLLVIIALFGGFGNGFGGFGGGNSVKDAYILGSDVSMISRQLSDGFNSIDNALDAQNTGICNLGYTQLQLTNQLGNQISDCCCKTQSGIERINTNNAMNTSSIISAVKDCCCEERAQFADLKYAMATENCATRQAIADGTKQIIDYMANKEMQNLRDENFALKLSSSQEHQNNVLINTLRPVPVPSFPVPSPFYYGNGFYNGTTIA